MEDDDVDKVRECVGVGVIKTESICDLLSETVSTAVDDWLSDWYSAPWTFCMRKGSLFSLFTYGVKEGGGGNLDDRCKRSFS